MPRISMWKENKTNDYKFIDRCIAEQFVVGGTGVGVHKYLGPIAQGVQRQITIIAPINTNVLTFPDITGVLIGHYVTGANIALGTTVSAINVTAGTITISTPTTAQINVGSTIGFSADATAPSYVTDSVTNIQDLLFLENRDRKYDTDVYVMRGVYTRSDNDFDLSQFGLFLQNGTIMMTFHLNEMVDNLGRRIMNGDVVELFHLRDDHALDTEAALKRYYVAADCSWATEGFSPTWYPHLWRVKLNPLVDSQEYKDITKRIKATNTLGPKGTSTADPFADIISTYDKYISVNEAVVAQAENDVPLSGYDVSKIYSPPVDACDVVTTNAGSADAAITSDSKITSDQGTYSPPVSQNPTGHLTGDGLAPNGLAVAAGVSFPTMPSQGDYCLRLDYLPNRLFRYDGRRWVKMEDNVRTNLTNGAANNTTLRNSFVNNTNTLTLTSGEVVPELQTLSQALRPKADN